MNCLLKLCQTLGKEKQEEKKKSSLCMCHNDTVLKVEPDTEEGCLFREPALETKRQDMESEGCRPRDPVCILLQVTVETSDKPNDSSTANLSACIRTSLFSRP